MLGAIIGDIAGSVYEFQPTKSLDFPLFSPNSTFTDDTVLTMATAVWILEGENYANLLKDFTRRYPHRGYGSQYHHWALSNENAPYNSFGNGSAMRVSPVGFAFSTQAAVLEQAKANASFTHSHPEGIRGAQATALAIFLARQNDSKMEIKNRIEKDLGYNLSRTYKSIQPGYVFNETCQGSVPEALIAFLASKSYEDAIRKAIALGGDADTQACIAGGIAEAFYKGIPAEIKTEAANRLPGEFKGILNRFYLEKLGTNLNL
jgi:ADP-ribosylglycohydrolase